jgi:hypothetical protein
MNKILLLFIAFSVVCSLFDSGNMNIVNYQLINKSEGAKMVLKNEIRREQNDHGMDNWWREGWQQLGYPDKSIRGFP